MIMNSITYTHVLEAVPGDVGLLGLQTVLTALHQRLPQGSPALLPRGSKYPHWYKVPKCILGTVIGTEYLQKLVLGSSRLLLGRAYGSSSAATAFVLFLVCFSGGWCSCTCMVPVRDAKVEQVLIIAYVQPQRSKGMVALGFRDSNL